MANYGSEFDEVLLSFDWQMQNGFVVHSECVYAGNRIVIKYDWAGREN